MLSATPVQRRKNEYKKLLQLIQPEKYTLISDEKFEKLGVKFKEFDDRKQDLENRLDSIVQKTKDLKDEEIETADKDAKAELEKQIEEVNTERSGVMKEYAKDNVLLHQLADLALLANNMLKGKALSEFINRSIEVL